MYGITPRQKTVFDFIASYIEEHGYSPSYREIGSGCGLKSTSQVHGLVHRLKVRGWLRDRPGSSTRSVTIVRSQAA
jgi:SOS-response transcriptional repressor LexA